MQHILTLGSQYGLIFGDLEPLWFDLRRATIGNGNPASPHIYIYTYNYIYIYMDYTAKILMLCRISIINSSEARPGCSREVSRCAADRS